MKETSFPAEGAKAPSGSKAKRENDVSDNRISQEGKNVNENTNKIGKMNETVSSITSVKAPSGSKAKLLDTVSYNRISQKGKMSSIMKKPRGKNTIIPDLLPIS